MMEKILIKDMLDYEIIHSIKAVGNTILVTKKTMDEKENKYNNDLYKVDIKNHSLIPYTSSKHVSSFIEENDHSILFVDSRTKNDEPEDKEKKTVYYRLDLHGGEATKAFEIPYDVFDMKLVDHKFAVCLIGENLHEDKEEDYIELTQVPFVANGAGFIDGNRNSLIIYDLDTKETKRVVEKGFDVESYIVKDHQIYYTGKKWENILTPKSELYCYDMDSMEIKQLLKADYDIAAFIDDHDSLVLFMSDMVQYDTDSYHDLYRYDLIQDRLTKICDYEYPFHNAVGSDMSSQGNGPFYKVNDKITFITTKGYRSNISTIQNNSIEKLIEKDFNIHSYCFVDDIYYVIGMEKGKLPEVYMISNDKVECITNMSKVLEDKDVIDVQYIPFINRKEMKIDGWIMYPKDFDESKKYPAIMNIHGGPRGAYGDVFFHEMQVFANEGYFVFFCNPQGSDGYGADFGDMRGQYGKKDYDDFMDFIDHVLNSFPNIDEDKLGVMGGSYGGFMTNWIITHNSLFKAACSQRSISNWVSDYGTSGISYLDGLHYHARPWEGMERMWNASPLKYAANCKTPTLFIHSFEDHTCDISQCYELFTAFKMLGIDTKAVLFKGENHGLSRNGKPKHRMKRLQEMVNWMNHYLKGE